MMICALPDDNEKYPQDKGVFRKGLESVALRLFRAEQSARDYILVILVLQAAVTDSIKMMKDFKWKHRDTSLYL